MWIYTPKARQVRHPIPLQAHNKQLTGRALLQPLADVAEEAGGRRGRGHDDHGGGSRGSRSISGGVRGWTDGNAATASSCGRGAGVVRHLALAVK